MKPPSVTDAPPPVLTLLTPKALLQTCAGRDRCSRRGRAIIMLFLDTEMRRGQLAGLRVDDFEHNVALVVGEERRAREAYKRLSPGDRL